MLKLPSLGELDRAVAVRIYLCVQPADMRRGFDTLAAQVKEFLRHDPFSGNLFLFVSRSKDRLKILYFETGGFALWYKRLEEGVFTLPAVRDDQGQIPPSVELKATELAMLLEGIDLKRLRRSPRLAGPASSHAAPPPGVRT